jgi:phenylalanyl-tRNA synthetase alpha chain
MSLKEQLENIRKEAATDLAAVTDAKSLEAVRVKYVGRNGALTAALDKLREVPKEERPVVGKLSNEIKTWFAAELEALQARLAAQSQRAESKVDITLPGRRPHIGKLHPLTQMTERIVTIFRRLGFAVADGPDIETEHYNFDALNTPAHHPSRDTQDTFYLDPETMAGPKRRLLRTQTSPVQIRFMETHTPPVRIIAPGRCYRRDNPDATHSATFHQVEGLYVDRNVSVADLKSTLDHFAKELLGPDVRTRFRPHFFPFTEPSFEMDFAFPGGAAKGKEWLEILGCGMVNPKVFEAVGYDPEAYTGYAFGMGIERLAMIMYGIDDIRLFYENDVRFLGQF